jgi:4-amino-4-deoxy-L-arabinose transferase-like glycosyltransferase
VISPAASSAAAVRRQAAWLFGLALGLRLLVVAFAASRFAPADDGSFYHAVAQRIARGEGYTWAWPNGVVTYAAHYPVGYPALLGGAYALLGPRPVSAMLVNAVVGGLLVVGVHACALRVTTLARARLAGLAIALHPTFVLYTAALMTEVAAVSALMLLSGYALFIRAKERGFAWRLPLGVGGAVMVLIRPQLLPLLPLLGAVAISAPAQASRWQQLAIRLRGAAEVLLVGVLCCAPWTLRNCAKMDGCVFVSANGGWNLLIGTLPEGQGSFAPIARSTVPVECREVFGEAGKDRCFGRAGLRRIQEEPLTWLGLAPRKLGQVFDHAAVASSYLQTSNPALVTDRVRKSISTIETLSSRLLLLGACLGLLRGATCWWGRGFSLAGALFTLSPWGYLAELGVLGALLSMRPDPGRRPLFFLAASVLGLCVITHIVFFGAARYGLIWTPWLPLLMAASESFDSGARGRG